MGNESKTEQHTQQNNPLRDIKNAAQQILEEFAQPIADQLTRSTQEEVNTQDVIDFWRKLASK
jgi:hypothetical protein